MRKKKTEAKIVAALAALMNANKWGSANLDVFFNSLGKVNNWDAKDFFDHWTRQPNHPLLDIRIKTNPSTGEQTLSLKQSRAMNRPNSIYEPITHFLSPYNWTWYVPLSCSFGNEDTGATREQTFYIDQQEFSQVINGKDYKWVHCDRKFAGFFATNYEDNNWEELGAALRNKDREIVAEDAANIIHSAFINAYSERLDYQVVVDVLSYLSAEEQYLPWRTVHKHLSDMLGVLEYRKSFYEVSNYFGTLLREVETKFDIWNPQAEPTEEQKDFHVIHLLKETIIELGLKVQDSLMLEKTQEKWELAFPDISNGHYDNTMIPPYMREHVFNYHIQNTYKVDDWEILLRNYETVNDVIEKRKFLEALSFSKLPWLLSRFFVPEEKNGVFNKLGLAREIQLLSSNPLGRELAWDYYRINFAEIVDKYFGLEDPRLGGMLYSITYTFENYFLFVELIEFLAVTEVGANGNARFLAVEQVWTNDNWLMDKEDQIMLAFSSPRNKVSVNSEQKLVSSVRNESADHKEKMAEFKKTAAEMYKKYLSEKMVAQKF